MIELPGYIIEKRLGHGGMAKVYLARHIGLDRLVAIKVLSKDLHGDKSFSERFIREARIVANLSHQNIITVYDVGVHNEYHYIAMEYLPGETLDDKIKNKLSIKQILSITKQIAAALNFAHKKNIIHRDVKPDNILFREDGSAVLTDFGIARATTSETKMTATGTVIGTPHYMSPEQAQGLTIGSWSDIYSLGIVLFEMLNGSVPFDADSTIAVVFKHITAPVPDLDEPYTQYQPLVNTMLAKEPDSRYQTGREVIADIEALDRGESAANATLIFNQTAINPNVDTTVEKITTKNTSPNKTQTKKIWLFTGIAIAFIALAIAGTILLPVKISNNKENVTTPNQRTLALTYEQQKSKEKELEKQAAKNTLIQKQRIAKEKQLTADLEQEKRSSERAERIAQQKQSKAEAETLKAKRELWALKKKQLEQRKKTAIKNKTPANKHLAKTNIAVQKSVVEKPTTIKPEIIKPISVTQKKTQKTGLLAGWIGNIDDNTSEYIADLFKAADNALEASRYASAKINYEKILQFDSNNQRAKKGIADTKEQILFKLNTKRKNSNSNYINDLLKAADNALETDHLSSAIANYRKVLQQTKDNVHATKGIQHVFKRHLQLALIEAQDGDFDDAQDAINAARKITPNAPEIDITIKKINQLQKN